MHAKVKYHFFISCKSLLPKFIASIKNMSCHPGCCRMKFIFFIFVEVVFIFQLGILFVNLNLCYFWCSTNLVTSVPVAVLLWEKMMFNKKQYSRIFQVVFSHAESIIIIIIFDRVWCKATYERLPCIFSAAL